MVKNSYKDMVTGIKTGGFIARLFGYVFLFFTLFVLLNLAVEIILPMGKNSGSIVLSLKLLGWLLLTATPFILWERAIRRFRRKHGLSIWKNVSAELEQMGIDERVAKEHKAFVNNGIVKDPSGDKTDIGYWFGLLEKGAITQVEYEAKKKELLKL